MGFFHKHWKIILAIVIVLVIVIILAIGLGVGLKKDGSSKSDVPSVPAARRINCAPEATGDGMSDSISAEACAQRGCVYAPSDNPNVPVCFINPSEGSGYRLEVTEDINTVNVKSYILQAVGKGMYEPPIPRIKLTVEEWGNSVLRIKFDDANETSSRYQVPWDLAQPGEEAISEPLYDFAVVSNEPFAFKVIRRSTNTAIFDTSVGGLMFSDRFLQAAIALPSSNVYGLGENVHTQFRHDLNYRRWPIFARDQPPGHGTEENLYSTHPFYECVEDGEGNTHGVLLYNSNAMEYEFTPEPMLIFRTIGGILDFYIFMGPSPEEVNKQYTAAIGRPYMPPLWSLGFQLSRYGYPNSSELMAAVGRTRDANIPLDVVHWDIDYMDHQRDFTIDPINYDDMPSLVDQLFDEGIRSIVILDPALEVNDTYFPYVEGHAEDVFIRWESRNVTPPEDFEETGSTEMLGWVWPEYKTVFPDFFLPQTQTFWNKWLKKLHDEIVGYHGLWLDMNEPANFGTNDDKPWNYPEYLEPWSLKCPENNYWDDPPYGTKAAYYYNQKRLSDKTICMQAVQGPEGRYRHYDVHSLFGHQQIKISLGGMREALSRADNRRGMILTRSSFVGTGQYAGRWLGDNTADWEHLRDSIIGIMEFNIFGIPYVGADICGYFGDTTVELCKRWMQLGAFYTFSRNHNGRDNIHQDPGDLGPEVVDASRQALGKRYELLPYLYTLFHEAHKEGGTVLRPLFHEFPRDTVALGVDTQFLWGPALMICPILHKGATGRQCYFPEGKWFYYDQEHSEVTAGEGTDQGRNVTVEMDDVPLFLRGGYILPTQVPGHKNTMDSRERNFILKAALDTYGLASGSLYWDDGETVDAFENSTYFSAEFSCNSAEKLFNYNVSYHDCDGCTHSNAISSVQISGLTSNVTKAELSIEPGSWTHVDHTQKVEWLNIDLESAGNANFNMTQDFSVRWS